MVSGTLTTPDWGAPPAPLLEPTLPSLAVFTATFGPPHAGSALIGVDAELTTQLIDVFSKEGNEILKPGFVRISLPYYASDKEVSFVADAMAFVAEHGWKLVPQYVPNARSGTWRHVNGQSLPSEQTLASISYSGGQMRMLDIAVSSELPSHDALLAEALSHAAAALEQLKLADGNSAPTLTLEHAAEAKRWFLMPWEAADLARGIAPKAESPFWPPLRGTVVPLLQKKMASYKVKKPQPGATTFKVKKPQLASVPSTEATASAVDEDQRRHFFSWRCGRRVSPAGKEQIRS
jgi:hypothetical protein